MIPSNTICVSQEGPANALALNKDCTQVVIAGRNVFKVFSIGEDEFSEVCNLRVGKNLNLNFSSIDVAWSTIEENTLATAATNGAVVVWNLGRSGRSKQEHVFSDHKRTVNKVSFHLTEPSLLISGSQDGMMKCFDLRMKEVWDMHGKPNLEYTIYTIASVGHVKWRPQKKYQVASCALVLDCAVHVWDVRRPHVPLATFAEHRDVTTAIAWLSPAAFLSTSRDCSLYRHRFLEAAHPVLWANPQSVCISARGEVVHAVPECPLPALAAPPAATPAPPADRHVPGLGRKQPTAGSLSASAQAALERAFPGGAASVVARHWPAPADALLHCARRYRMRGEPPHMLAKHNAAVAREAQRHCVEHVWEVVRAVCPPAKFAKQMRDDEAGCGWVSAASAHYVDVEALDWTLPEEAFPLRSAPPAPLALHALPHHAHLPHLAHLHHHHHHHYDDIEHDGVLGGAGCGSSSPGGSSSGASGGSGSHDAAHRTYSHQNSISTMEEVEGGEGGEGGEAGALSVRVGEERSARPDVAPLLAQALQLHAALGDVQTAAVVCIVLHEHRSDLFSYIEESLQEQWLLGYIELLQRHKLWNVATESVTKPDWDRGDHSKWCDRQVVRCAWLSSVWSLSQQSSSVAACCGRCGRRTRTRAPCERCAPRRPDLCAVCHQVVRGLYAWCQGCSHGGHLLHMRSWMQQHRICPAGCGHYCQLA
ncbi:WD repeat-containing protein 24 [Papilio machaon]|uniref:GATOR2 complex protein WDR24 n=1 Tax=Papilio machaon TaxID=76193 RepID=A0A194RDU3_PAPMA|nr:WD repeat-containing protein 24 [Papilio machaon]